jgi:hypothetical protein
MVLVVDAVFVIANIVSLALCAFQIAPFSRAGESLLEASGRVRGLASEPRLDSVV